MSGAAEGLAGLALSAISVATLFSTCIECFDIVIAGKNFSEDFEQLCALVNSASVACKMVLLSVIVFPRACSIWSLGRICWIDPRAKQWTAS